MIDIRKPNLALGMSESEWGSFSAASCEKSRQLPAIYRELAQQLGCAFFDPGTVILQPGSDGVHLTAEGHLRLAETLTPVIREIL